MSLRSVENQKQQQQHDDDSLLSDQVRARGRVSRDPLQKGENEQVTTTTTTKTMLLDDAKASPPRWNTRGFLIHHIITWGGLLAMVYGWVSKSSGKHEAYGERLIKI